MKVAILLTCFNRKPNTIRCLQAILDQRYIDFNNVEIFLVDDGSTDGTSEAIENQFPTVNVIHGNGSLYWNGGMSLAWNYAADSDSDFDAYIWINDDVSLNIDSLCRIIDAYQSLTFSGINVGAICGLMADSNGVVTYGGQKVLKGDKLEVQTLPLEHDFHQVCDTINGNFVLVSKSGYSKVGNLESVFTHQMGDFDYGYRLNKEGFLNFQLKGVAGYCESNSSSGTYRDVNLPFRKRLELLERPNQIAPVEEWLHFIRCYSGRKTTLRYSKLMLRKYLPSIWLLFFGR